MKNLLKKNKSYKGFSIIEVMVAVGIIGVGMLGVVSLMIQNIQVQVVNKNNLTASMLAQEGIELVRFFRDSNWLDPAKPGFSGGIPATSTIDIFGFQSSGLDFSNTATDLKLNADGFYEHNGTIDTAFKRLITVSSNVDYMTVKSTVRWVRNGKNYDYIVETLLYDWR